MANNSSQNQDFSDLLEAFDIGDLPKELDKQADKGSQNSSRLVTPTFENGSADNSVDQPASNSSKATEKSTHEQSEKSIANVSEKEAPSTITITPDANNDSETRSNHSNDIQETNSAIINQSDSFNFRIDSVRSVDANFMSDITPGGNNPGNTADTASLNENATPDCIITDAIIVKQEKDNSVPLKPTSVPSMKQQLSQLSSGNSVNGNMAGTEKARNFVVTNKERNSSLLNDITSSWTSQAKTMPASQALSRLVKVVENPSMTTVVKDSRIQNYGDLPSITSKDNVKIAPKPPKKSNAPFFVPVSMKNGLFVQSGPPTYTPTPCPPQTTANIPACPSTVQANKLGGSNKITSNLFVMSGSDTNTTTTSTHKITMRKIVVGGKTQMQSVTIGDETSHMNKTNNTVNPTVTNNKITPAVTVQPKKVQPQGVKLGTVQDVLVRPASVPIYTPEEPPKHIKDIMKKIPKYKCVECGDTFLLETSWSNHRRRRTCIITLNCPVCHKTIVCYNRCVLMAHLAMPRHSCVSLNDAYYQMLPKNLLNNVMAVQMEPAPKKSLDQHFAGLPAFLDKMAENTRNKVINDIVEVCSHNEQSPNSSLMESVPSVSPEQGTTTSPKDQSQIMSSKDTSPVVSQKNKGTSPDKDSSVKEAQHIPTYPTDPSCVECGQKFKDKSRMGIHFSCVRRNSYFKLKCMECGKYLSSGCALRAHLRLHKETKPYVCPECGTFIQKKEILKTHVEKYCCHYNRIVRLKCSKCDKNVYSPDGFMSHLHDDHVELYLKCQRCPMAFRSHEGILKHAERVHNTTDIVWKNIHKCPLCDTVFHEVRALNQHLRMHVNDKKNDPNTVYHCSDCKEDFITLNTFKYHMSTEHNEKLILYFCNYCGLNFQYQAALERHMQRHMPGITKCSICPEKFPNINALNQHTSQVHNLKVKITDISRSSSRSNSTGPPTPNGVEIQEVDIVEIKDVPKWIPCSVCGHRYPNEESLEKHVKLDHHGGSSSMPCHLCGVVLSDNTALQHHLDTLHVGNKSKFVCHLCSKEGIMHMSFTKITTLEKHLKSVHRLTRSLVDIDLFSMDAENPDDRIKRESSADSDISQPPVKRLRLDGENEYSCAKCTFSVNNRKEFTEHIETHKMNDQDSQQCQECGMSFVIRTALKRHLFMVHKIRNFNKYQLDTGIDLVSPEKEAKSVNLCSITNGHVEPKEGDVPSNPLECRVCHKVCETDTALRTHMRSHGMAFIRSKRNVSSPPETDK